MGEFKQRALHVSKTTFGYRLQQIPIGFLSSSLSSFYDCGNTRWYVQYEPGCETFESMALIEEFAAEQARLEARDGDGA